MSNPVKKVLVYFHMMPLNLLALAEQKKGVHYVEPIINLVPLVIRTLEFPYHSATAHHLCARAAGYIPRQTPFCPAFFQQTGPTDM